MNTQEIADKLVGLLRYGKFEEAQKEFFDQDAVSTEPPSSNLPEVRGLDSILQKGAQFRNSVEAWHDIKVSAPIVAKNYFALQLNVELTFKGQEKSEMDELIVYHVADGKIKHEQFFY